MDKLSLLVFDGILKYMYRTISARVVQALSDQQKMQNPPFSKGLLYVQIREQFTNINWSTKYIYCELGESIMGLLARNDQVYTDSQIAKFSAVRIDSTWLTFSERVATRYPGYVLDNQYCFINKSDVTVNLTELINLLKSKDIERYH